MEVVTLVDTEFATGARHRLLRRLDGAGRAQARSTTCVIEDATRAIDLKASDVA